MRAALIERPRVIGFRDVADPTPEPGGVVVRVGACAVCGTDLRIYTHGHHRISFPAIIGHEIAGTITAVGEGVAGYAVGDRVVLSPPGWSCGQCRVCRRGGENLCERRRGLSYEHPGGFAEFVAVPAPLVRNGSLHQLPLEAEFAEVAVTEPLACCINGQSQVRWRPDDRVLVIGGGPIGLMHAELIRARGADALAIADLSEERLRILARFNDLTAIDARDPKADEHVRSWSGGDGPDTAIVATSAPAACLFALSVVARGGQVLFFAGLPKDKQLLEVNLNLIHYRQLACYGSFGSTPAQGAHALELLLSRSVNPARIVTHRFGLDKLGEAFSVAEAFFSLKIVILPERAGAEWTSR